MRKNACLNLVLVFILWGVFSSVFAQTGRPYEGPDDPAGDIQAERVGFMNGNNVYLQFRNTTELSDCCDKGYWVSRWPADYNGTKMHDGIASLIGARVYLDQDSLPITDLDLLGSSTIIDTLYYCQSSYRELMDISDFTGTLEWALYPVFGYFNVAETTPAMSNKSESWPPAGWPARGDELKWPGVWNGRFGLGEFRADLETYYVANDAQDQEYLPVNNNHKGAHYYPRPGVLIGDKNPDVSIQKGLPWGGIGIRVEVRGFQWKNPEAADAIFFEYNIANISDYDLAEMYFGFHIDNAVGGEEHTGADDIAYYDESLAMCYSWDLDGVQVGGGVPGIMGIAFLESPGIPDDRIDNDKDGLTDEKRDNEAVNFIDPLSDPNFDLAVWNEAQGIDDPADTSTIRWHWDADEDMDWHDGLDLNGNNTYVYFDTSTNTWRLEEGEVPGDDVGVDGSSPFDLDYPGPDPDGSEGNHRPDFVEGIGSEPNFALTDIGESDMLGLTSFKYNLDWGTYGPNHDENEWFWLVENPKPFDEYLDDPRNFVENFASGIFKMEKGRTERVSFAELHAFDALHEQSGPPFSAPALFKLKEVTQNIYESDYQFAQPPLMPKLKATPGDGQVVLSWDNIAEKFTTEPLLGNINDFEGYKLYKSTDPFMADNKVITDGFGTPSLIKPIFQCDLVNEKKGFTDYGYRNGSGYYLGDDSGIQNYYIDTDVENGRTYYYVLVAYDYGINEGDVEVGPSENTYTIDVSRDESVNAISQNVAIVTPHQLAIGHKEPETQNLDYNNSFGKNTIQPEVLVKSNLKNNNQYKVKFEVDTVTTDQIIFNSFALSYRNNGVSVYNMTENNALVYHEDEDNFAGSNFKLFVDEPNSTTKIVRYEFDTTKELESGVFEGIRMRYRVPTLEAQWDSVNSGWITGNSDIKIHYDWAAENRIFPFDYDIVFTETLQNESQIRAPQNIVGVNNELIFNSNLLFGEPLPFYVVNRSLKDTLGNPIHTEVIVQDLNGNGQYDMMEDRIYVGHLNDLDNARGTQKNRFTYASFGFDFKNVTSEELLPKPNDVYHVTFLRGMITSDSITFSVNVPDDIDKSEISERMDDIRVVPNPYVMVNTMEPAVANWDRNQSRRLMFTNIPAQCTIKIFTVNGLLVDEIDVNNSTENRSSEFDLNSDANGTAFWDLLNKNGLEIAAGYYIYHVKSKLTGDTKTGKFAVIK